MRFFSSPFSLGYCPSFHLNKYSFPSSAFPHRPPSYVFFLPPPLSLTPTSRFSSPTFFLFPSISSTFFLLQALYSFFPGCLPSQRQFLLPAASVPPPSPSLTFLAASLLPPNLLCSASQFHPFPSLPTSSFTLPSSLFLLRPLFFPPLQSPTSPPEHGFFHLHYSLSTSLFFPPHCCLSSPALGSFIFFLHFRT